MLTQVHYLKLQWVDPGAVFNQVAHLDGTIFLDSSSRQSNYGRYSFIMFEPLVTYLPKHNKLQLTKTAKVTDAHNIQEALISWQALFIHNKSIYNSELPPFVGGLVGYFSYDLSKKLARIPARFEEIVPDYCLGLYNKVIAFDHKSQKTYLLLHEVEGFAIDATYELMRLENLCAAAVKEPAFTRINTSEQFLDSPIEENINQEEYFAMFNMAREYILSGEFYEINLAKCFKARLKKDYSAVTLYNKMKSLNPTPFAAYLDYKYLFANDFKILSTSPERFLKIRENTIEACPIKGTIRRSSDCIEDQNLKKDLENSEKNRAENIMIVDLLRNDLGRICSAGSINVSQLCHIESFANLHHMVSVINATLARDKSIFDIIPEVFPGGSITGAPKIRAMQSIEELEREARGVYCGSIGYFSFNGNVDLNIAIRTISIIATELRFYSGSAITLDSDCEEEYQEVQLKAQKIFETLGVSNHRL